ASRSSWRAVLLVNAFFTQRVAATCCSPAGAAFSAAPDDGSDQRRNGTQDVNDPMYGPATRPKGPVGVVHVLGSACGVRNRDQGAAARRKCLPHATRYAHGSTHVLNNQNTVRDRRGDTLLALR